MPEELASLLHLLLCKKHHSNQMEELTNRKEETCYFFLEETLDSCWECEDHLLWKTKAEVCIEQLELENADKALTFLKEVLKLCQQLNELISEKPKSLNFVKGMIG